MVDVVGSVSEVLRLVLVIKEAADAVRHNKAACLELKNTVDTLGGILAPVDNMDMSKNPPMRAALMSLDGALRRGHSLVITCQRERNIICIFLTAKSLSKKLMKVNAYITDKMILAHFAIGANTHVLVTFIHSKISQSSLHPPPLKGAGVTDNSNTGGEVNLINYVGAHIVNENDDDPVSSTLRIFSHAELRDATHLFSEGNVIRKGGRAIVYKGALPGELVAIKTYPDKSGALSIEKYITVFQLLTEHENVVKLLGFCNAGGTEMVVEEYMPKGSLFEIIIGSSQKLDWHYTFQVIRGVAQGVTYLHSKGVIHLDLNPASIVLHSNMNPKISNFERSKLLDENVSEVVSHELVGTMGYMSPEYITDGTVAMTTDVFAFGVLLIHSICGMRSSLPEQHPITWAWEVREAKGMNGLLDSSWGSEPELAEIKRCMEIGLLCTQEFRQDRPTMPDVVKFLNGNETLPTPKKPGFI